jgi:hypothetical protein
VILFSGIRRMPRRVVEALNEEDEIRALHASDVTL